jgi:curved DNA-binding protein CbpA
MLWQTVGVTVDTLYDLLGVPRDADVEEIRAAYRRLSKIYHPDLGGTAAIFRQLQEAREILTDPIRRSAYDRSIRTSAAGVLHEEPKESPGSRRLLATSSRGPDSLLWGGRGRRRPEIATSAWMTSVIGAGVLVGLLLEPTHGIILILLVIVAIFAWRRQQSIRRRAEVRDRAAQAAAELNRTAREAAEQRATRATPTERSHGGQSAPGEPPFRPPSGHGSRADPARVLREPDG